MRRALESGAIGRQRGATANATLTTNVDDSSRELVAAKSSFTDWTLRLEISAFVRQSASLYLESTQSSRISKHCGTSATLSPGLKGAYLFRLLYTESLLAKQLFSALQPAAVRIVECFNYIGLPTLSPQLRTTAKLRLAHVSEPISSIQGLMIHDPSGFSANLF
jgi:hypothetical protein